MEDKAGPRGAGHTVSTLQVSQGIRGCREACGRMCAGSVHSPRPSIEGTCASVYLGVCGGSWSLFPAGLGGWLCFQGAHMCAEAQAWPGACPESSCPIVAHWMGAAHSACTALCTLPSQLPGALPSLRSNRSQGHSSWEVPGPRAHPCAPHSCNSHVSGSCWGHRNPETRCDVGSGAARPCFPCPRPSSHLLDCPGDPGEAGGGGEVGLGQSELEKGQHLGGGGPGGSSAWLWDPTADTCRWPAPPPTASRSRGLVSQST